MASSFREKSEYFVGTGLFLEKGFDMDRLLSVIKKIFLTANICFFGFLVVVSLIIAANIYEGEKNAKIVGSNQTLQGESNNPKSEKSNQQLGTTKLTDAGKWWYPYTSPFFIQTDVSLLVTLAAFFALLGGVFHYVIQWIFRYP